MLTHTFTHTHSHTHTHTHTHTLYMYVDTYPPLPSQSHVHSGESIKVFVRVRPPDPNLTLEVGEGACLEATTQMAITVHCKPEPRVFTFDHVAGMETTQVIKYCRIDVLRVNIIYSVTLP